MQRSHLGTKTEYQMSALQNSVKKIALFYLPGHYTRIPSLRFSLCDATGQGIGIYKAATGITCVTGLADD